MNMRPLLGCVRRAAGPAACLGVMLAGLAAGVAGQSGEELARRHYELGLGFMRSEKYAEALKDFQAVVDSFPTSSVAGDALVQIASYHLDVARDVEAAQTTTDIILKKYASSPAAAMGHVLSGRIAMEKGRQATDLDTALASFERVPALFPTSDVVPVAMYYAGHALQTVRRYDAALDRFRDVTERYPTSIWAARALLGSAVCLVQAGRQIPATAALQRVRLQFPGTAEADTALKWNTILYRLYVRAPGQLPYAFSGRFVGSATAKFKDVVGVVLDGHDNLLLAHQTAVSVFDPRGTMLRSIPADRPSALALDVRGVPVVVRQNMLLPDGGRKPINISILQPEGKVRTLDEIPAAAMNSRGDWLLADGKANEIQMFSASGKPVRLFASVAATRLALDELDALAALDGRGKSVVVFDREGKPITRVPARGPGYELDEPVDLALDRLGHIYVLDRGKSAVLVFNRQGRLVASFAPGEKGPGAFQRAAAFGLDSAARLYIFDERVQRVQVYQ